MWCKGGISKIQIAIGSLGHAIKVLFGPTGSFISPAGSKSINKRPCYCQDAPPRRAFLGCWWYHDMKYNLMTSATTEKRCLLITFWAPKHRFGCQKSCIRQLPALAFTHSKDARRQREACGLGNKSPASPRLGREGRGQLIWDREASADKSAPVKSRMRGWDIPLTSR